MPSRTVTLSKDGSAFLAWHLDAPATTVDVEYVAGSLRGLLDQNKPGAIKKVTVAFSTGPIDDSGLELGCHLQAILPKLAPLKEVVLEFIEAPKDINAMIMTPISEMPRTRVRVTPVSVDTLE